MADGVEATFLKREPRTWTETCDKCGGCGVVQRREHFALWTPDEYGPVEPLGAEHEVPADAYVCTVVGVASSTIFKACREGVEVAETVKRPVAFEFNGAVVVCHEGDDPEAVAKEWWVRAYGKTYEESLGDR